MLRASLFVCFAEGFLLRDTGETTTPPPPGYGMSGKAEDALLNDCKYGPLPGIDFVWAGGQKGFYRVKDSDPNAYDKFKSAGPLKRDPCKIGKYDQRQAASDEDRKKGDTDGKCTSVEGGTPEKHDRTGYCVTRFEIPSLPASWSVQTVSNSSDARPCAYYEECEDAAFYDVLTTVICLPKDLVNRLPNHSYRIEPPDLTTVGEKGCQFPEKWAETDCAYWAYKEDEDGVRKPEHFYMQDGKVGCYQNRKLAFGLPRREWKGTNDLRNDRKCKMCADKKQNYYDDKKCEAPEYVPETCSSE